MVTRVQKLIGKSYQNRDIYLYEFFVENPKFNVLLTGSVHGIEKEGGDALGYLMNDIEANSSFYDDINIAIVQYWNPDGIANNTYDNAQGFSINYSSMSACTPEFQALWNYLMQNKYYPDFHIDNHTLDHWNRGSTYWMYNHVPRLAYYEDTVIDCNLSSLSRHKMTFRQWTDMVNHVKTNAGSSYNYEKFWELNDYVNFKWIIKYDIAETQQWFAMRFDALTFLIEQVCPADQTPTNPLWEPTKQSQFLANKYMMDWARNHPELCGTKSAPPYVGEVVPINETYVWDTFPTYVKCENDTNGSLYYFWSTATQWLWTQSSTNYLPVTPNSKHWTTAPLGYAVHTNNEEDLNTFLKYFGFQWTAGTSNDSFDTEQFHCTTADAWNDLEGDIPFQFPQANRDGYYVSATRSDFSDYTIYYVDQMGGLSLIHMLEPMSENNMSAYQTLFPTLELVEDDDFPVIRLISRRNV